MKLIALIQFGQAVIWFLAGFVCSCVLIPILVRLVARSWYEEKRRHTLRMLGLAQNKVEDEASVETPTYGKEL